MSFKPDFDAWWEKNYDRVWVERASPYYEDAKFIWDACADALLEALKEGGKHTGGKAPTLSINILPEQQGWLIFIPDEEEK